MLNSDKIRWVDHWLNTRLHVYIQSEGIFISIVKNMLLTLQDRINITSLLSRKILIKIHESGNRLYKISLSRKKYYCEQIKKKMKMSEKQ